MILDTNALSAWADGTPGARAPLESAKQIVIPSIVLGEYLFGIQQSRKRARYHDWISKNLRYARIATVGHQTAQHYATIRLQLKRRAGPIPSNDTWIAALAIQHKLPIMSNDRHFDEVENVQRISF